jgi:hypothetical protein
VVRILIVIMAGLLLLTGCGSYWEDQGTAAVRNASARQAQAEAARQNAEAAIIEARAQGALAESQAQALTQSVGAVVDLADDGEYVVVFAGIAFAVLAFAGWAIWAMARRPAAAAPPPVERHQPRQWLTIETTGGPVRMIQEPHETQQEFTLRVALLAARLSEAETAGRLLGPGEVRR